MTKQQSVYKELLILKTANVINIDRLAREKAKDLKEIPKVEARITPSNHVPLSSYLKRLCVNA